MFLVTGGAGFIGSNIAAALEPHGGVVVCDRLRRGDKWRNVAKRAIVDFVSPEHLFEWLSDRSDLDAVVHMGAVTATTETDADLMIDVNFRLSVRLWQWCAARRTPFLYASSASTYGDGTAGFADADDDATLARLRPLNIYGWSKHLFDRWVSRAVAAGAPRPPQWAGLKFFNVYGPNEYHKGAQSSIVPRIVPTVRAGEPVRLFRSHRPDCPDGGQKRDFVWVGDCAGVVQWLLDNPKVSGLFNCGTGRARTFADLATAVCRALGREPAIEYVAMPEALRPHYQYFTEARLDRLRAAGYDRPFTGLEQGIAAYVQGYLDTADPYR
jgi:ADP-L-glycero-D-manno-heptose 6-epimerase